MLAPHPQAVPTAGGAVPHGMDGGQYASLVSHLSPTHARFLSHWWRLIDLEESQGRGVRSHMWAMSGAEREAGGSACLAGMQLQVREAGQPGTAS